MGKLNITLIALSAFLLGTILAGRYERQEGLKECVTAVKKVYGESK